MMLNLPFPNGREARAPLHPTLAPLWNNDLTPVKVHSVLP